MVSKEDTITVNTKCSCGHGDEEKSEEKIFENVCPNCGREGTLSVQTRNSEPTDSSTPTQDYSETGETEDSSKKTEPSTSVVVCNECGSEYCGQDGYDLRGGTRGRLHEINPDDIEEGDEEVSEEEDGETTYMSGWEGLCDLLKPLDALGMIVQRGDYVIVKKIEMPQTAKLWAYEGINVVDDSVSITDYTPEIYNTFIIKWGESYENELEFTFNKHKDLFGERKVVLEAKKVKSVEEGEEGEEGEDSEEKDEDEKSEKDKNPGIWDLISNSKETEEKLKNTDTKNLNVSEDDIEDATGSDDDEKSHETEEVPITDREEAIQFGLTQVGKAKRDDGHKIELKVIGNQVWQMGEWCHVRLPSFNEDTYMFISKCSFESSADSEYINSITLVDYPPTLGKPNKSKEEDKDQAENTENTENTENDENNENNENNDSENSGNNNESNNNNSGN